MQTLNKTLDWPPQYKVATIDSAGNVVTFDACTLTITNSASAVVYGPALGTAGPDASGYHVRNWPASTLGAGSYTATFMPTINGAVQAAEVFGLVLSAAPGTYFPASTTASFTDNENETILNPAAPVIVYEGQTDKAIQVTTAALNHTGGMAAVILRQVGSDLVSTIVLGVQATTLSPAVFLVRFPGGWKLSDLPKGDWLMQVKSMGGVAGEAYTSPVYLRVAG